MSYSPTIGRWMEQDPADYIDGPNLYQYENSSPTTQLDPTGLDGIMNMPGPGDHLGTANPPGSNLREEAYFESRFGQTRSAIMSQFTREINSQIRQDCGVQSFNPGLSRLIGYRSGGTPPEHFGDRQMSNAEDSYYLGSHTYVVGQVSVTYTDTNECCSGGGKKRNFTWTATLSVLDELGASNRNGRVTGPLEQIIFPTRIVTRASWPLSGSGSCCTTPGIPFVGAGN